MPKTKLKPCPFCGKRPKWRSGDNNTSHPYSAIYCSYYECLGPQTTAATYEDAAIQWNMRRRPK